VHAGGPETTPLDDSSAQDAMIDLLFPAQGVGGMEGDEIQSSDSRSNNYVDEMNKHFEEITGDFRGDPPVLRS
jgi:hypothetical protein